MSSDLVCAMRFLTRFKRSIRAEQLELKMIMSINVLSFLFCYCGKTLEKINFRKKKIGWETTEWVNCIFTIRGPEIGTPEST
ncbi:hypothetical protein I79_021282 [Cricetulus griseus]|uniref:Uncharacterized protein n=1 Tax=Cricetulus griseus TaxID=10029 RepID=G3IC92_CRIGR|nr:hypothetical protein I79_021282 [Cricetulus griseus]